jgi:hypothetical protein
MPDDPPQQLTARYDHWPSTTDKPFRPEFDAEARKRAIGVAAATLGLGPNGLAALIAYTRARAVAGTPACQPADLSGLAKAKPRPQDLAELLRCLLGPGARNKGVVLGDSNHLHEGIHEALADPEAVAALKEVGVTHVCLEVSPKTLERYRATTPGASLIDYLRNREAPLARVVRLCDAAGIAVVPMDIRGPAEQRYRDKLFRDADRKRGQEALQEFSKAEDEFFAERIRITRQVWVPRITETMRGSPNGKLIVLAGDGHIANPLNLGMPDIVHADLDESLASAFGAPVPYLRVVQKEVSHMHVGVPKRPQAEGTSGEGMDTPELILEVPTRARQEIARMRDLNDKPESVKRQAARDLERYDTHLRQFVQTHANVLALLGRAPARKDLDAVDGLLEARRLMLEGSKDKAPEVMKAARAVMESLSLAGVGHPRADEIRSMIGKMREAFGAIHGDEEPQQPKAVGPYRTNHDLPVPPLLPRSPSKQTRSLQSKNMKF